jgi:nitroreductase
MLLELIERNRSYRRFDEGFKIELDTLKELVNLARLGASGANLQPLKYIVSCDDATNETIFANLAWAAYLPDWPGPGKGQRPTGYVIVLHDKEAAKAPGVDHGIACQNILLGAVEKGLGGCMLGSVNRDELRKVLNIADRFDILLVVALGKPAETVIIEEVGADGNVKYWHDDNDTHHVPKRSLEDLIVETYG